jgi:hypothetical protein
MLTPVLNLQSGHKVPDKLPDSGYGSIGFAVPAIFLAVCRSKPLNYIKNGPAFIRVFYHGKER